MLNDRKKEILQAIIEEYIQTAEPVSSNAIVQKYNLDYSSATVRNEMADLEKEGFLDKPHTSAGRVPSAKGYRFYVDELLKDDNISLEEVVYIQSKLQTKKQFKEIEKNLSAQNDPINKEKHSNLRAATAEEHIIAFIILNPETFKNIKEKLSPENFSTSFNKRVYEFILEKHQESQNVSISDFREKFNDEEISKITSFLARENHRQSDLNSASEYINIILQESDKLTGEKLNDASSDVILEYIGKLREQKK